jgi:hypothetical protein
MPAQEEQVSLSVLLYLIKTRNSPGIFTGRIVFLLLKMVKRLQKHNVMVYNGDKENIK